MWPRARTHQAGRSLTLTSTAVTPLASCDQLQMASTITGKSAVPPGFPIEVSKSETMLTTTFSHSFGFNFSTNAAIYSSDQATALGWLGKIPSARGFFNIPVCDLTGHERVQSTDDLNTILEDQGKSYSSDTQMALWCYCADRRDMNGEYWSSYMPDELASLWDKSLNCDPDFGGGPRDDSKSVVDDACCFEGF
jgi:hypothetical protein